MRYVLSTVVFTAACSSAVPAPPARLVSALDDEADRRAMEARADARVGVRGIEGTLSSFDVRITMEKRSEEFAACHEPRANALPPLAGNVELAIHVLTDGRVSRVDVRRSDLGDRPLERCLVDVVANTQFPRPNGGEANVTWTMMLDSARPNAGPELWGEDRVARVVGKNAEALRGSCALASAPYDVTAYVSASGRVLSAGVSSPGEARSEDFDCIADALRAWPMPKPKKQYAKVSFAIAP